MRVVYERCCGLDVHKETVVACVILPDGHGQGQQETRPFATLTEQLAELATWLHRQQVTPVAMESTGVYWKPIYNVFEGSFENLVVNAEHGKPLKGRKTDVQDAEWLADWLRHGLLKGSFIPSAELRELRDLTHYRTKLGDARKSEINRLHKVLEDANLKLSSGATDLMGVSAQAILAELVKGNTDAARLAELAKGRLREKQAKLEKALGGNLKPHQRFRLAQHLSHIEFLDEAITKLEEQIAGLMRLLSPQWRQGIRCRASIGALRRL
jgi:transposase